MSASNYLVEAVTAAHDDDIWALQYLQDGRVLSASADRHLRIWDSSKSEEPLVSTTLTEEEDPKPSSIVGGEAEQNTSSSSYALVSVMGRSVFRISLKPDSLGAQEASWSSPELGQASTISLHPDPQVSVFAASGMEGMVRILSSAVDTFGEEKARIQSRGSFARVRYSPNGRMLATAMETGQVALYNAETYALVQYWTAHVGAIRALTFSPDSSLLITGGEDKQINVFDVKGAVPPRGEATSHRANGVTEQTNLRSRYNQAGQHVASLSGHTGWVVDLSCRDDGRVFASSSTDGTIRLWDLQRPNSACLATLREHESDVWCVRWAPTPGGLPQTIEGISGGGLGGGKLNDSNHLHATRTYTPASPSLDFASDDRPACPLLCMDDDDWLDDSAGDDSVIAQNSAREWSALESKFSDAGYREGISAGRGFTLQAGFDEGYSITGAPLGRELGYLRGLASSLLVYLTSSTASHTPCITSEDREAAVASAREIVRGLGKLKVQDLAPRDLEAEAHAREHGEEVQVPPELAEKREMESLEDQLAGMGSQIGQQEQPSGRQALDDCKLQLQNLLARLGLQALLS